MMPLGKPGLTLEPSTIEALPGWTADDHVAALKAFAVSCEKLTAADPAKAFGPDSWSGKISDWQGVCAKMPNPKAATESEARVFFEKNFTVRLATANGNPEGLFTGYYEASINGSLTKVGPYQIPLRERPSDLVMVDLGEFRPELKGQRIAGRVRDGNLKPYEDRAAIEDGKLPKDVDRPLYYTDSAVDAFYLQIQGSGVVTLPDGTTQRVGYDGQNGYPYYAIGKELVKRGHLTADTVTMDSIRAWLEKNPAEGRDVMRTNRSYVFFKKVDKGGAVGGQGVVLTAGRSLAIDRSLLPYGMPVYLDAVAPDPLLPPIRRLMTTQDTGGAIHGPVRGDVFWGVGQEAERLAGPMKSAGRYWFLLPVTVVH